MSDSRLQMLQARFMTHVHRVVGQDGVEHWIWTGTTNKVRRRKPRYYGRAYDPDTDRMVAAHRWAYRLFVLDGREPGPGKLVVHNHPTEVLISSNGWTNPKFPDGTPLTLCVNPSCLYESD
jgi:hypothetical protein